MVQEQQVQIKRGLECPHCGCKHLPVLYTRRVPGQSIMRVRECQNCKKRISFWSFQIISNQYYQKW